MILKKLCLLKKIFNVKYLIKIISNIFFFKYFFLKYFNLKILNLIIINFNSNNIFSRIYIDISLSTPITQLVIQI